jgi:hydrogenase expression/formation protein HypE
MKSPIDIKSHTFYPLGKLPQSELISLVSNYTTENDPRVIFGPGLGRDAAVIDFGDRYLVAKSDPITFATDQIGWYAVNVNANDIACMGAIPRWFLATILLPEGKTDYRLVDHIFKQMHQASAKLNISIVGGHTEITHSIDRPIIVGAMFGEVQPDRFIRSDGARPGDTLILTKGICVEGTAILARELGETLSPMLEQKILDKTANFLFEPGISVVKDARIIVNAGEVHAMHDPTEGGVATGLYEMMEAAGCGAVIDVDVLPYYPETKAICDILQLDPLGLIASGSLLAAVPPQDVQAISQALQNAGIPATIIGNVTNEAGIFRVNDHHQLKRFARDELTRVFE